MDESRPLDSIFPELAQARGPSAPNTPGTSGALAPGSGDAPVLSARVFEVELDKGWVWSTATWTPADVPGMFGAELGRLLEATALHELSKPPAYASGEAREILGMDLFAFRDLDEDELEAIARWGFTKTAYVPDAFASRMLSWQNEAESGGWAKPDRPNALYFAEVARPAARLWRGMTRAHEVVADALSREVWGARPGMMSKLMVDALSREMSIDVTPTLDGLNTLDMLLVDRVEGRFRWMPPMGFQGLCDFIGVVMMAELGQQVQWGMCSPTGHDMFLPPLLRLKHRRTHRDLEVGRELVRLCISPLPEDSDTVQLKDWLRGVAG